MPIEYDEEGQARLIALTAADIVFIMNQGAKGCVFMALLVSHGLMKKIPECYPAFTNGDQADRFQRDCAIYYQSGKN